MRQINCAKRTQTQWKQNNILTEDEMGAGIYNKLTLSYFRFWVSHKVATVPPQQQSGFLVRARTTAVEPACCLTTPTTKKLNRQQQETWLHPQKGTQTCILFRRFILLVDASPRQILQSPDRTITEKTCTTTEKETCIQNTNKSTDISISVPLSDQTIQR